MSNTETLKKYLLTKENPYLLDGNNNGKTIMLSGKWGSGKTHFWQKEIEPELKEKLEDKACVYVSLYGKESLSDIKSDVYLSASGKNLLSTEVSTFGMEALSAIKDSELAVGKVLKAGKGLIDSKKMQKGINKLKKGGVICFDDFERKSKNVDLNDLFGFISQLAINLECKVIIILNSEVFEDEEAKIFSRVKEKTISKFFYFNPTIEELFKSISDNSKYDALNDYKEDILSAIKETEELNARIYIQVLDNCLEWYITKNSSDAFKFITLITTYFIQSHSILTYTYINHDDYDGTQQYYSITYPNLNNFPLTILNIIKNITKIGDDSTDKNGISIGTSTKLEYINILKNMNCTIFIDKIEYQITYKNANDIQRYSETEQSLYLDWIQNNKRILCLFWKYGYQLFFMNDVDKSTYNEIYNFIETGILLP